MGPETRSFRLFIFTFFLLIFDFCCAYPTPHRHTSTVFPRQGNGLTTPVTVTQTQQINTDAGNFTETCTITLTPTVVNGTDMVIQEKSCTITPDNGNDGVPGALPPGSNSTVSTQLPSSTLTSSPTLTSTSGTPSSTSDVVSSSTTTGSPPAGSGSMPPPVVSTTLTSVPFPSSSSPPPLLPSDTGSSSISVSSSGGPVGVIGVTSVPRPTATPQPESSDSSNVGSPQSSSLPLPDSTPSSSSSLSSTATPEAQAAFDPPGKKLEVLPIGLGVFAGVSVIALFVVGIVTYERTKHRRNFRKLRLQEAGNRMGYGAT